MHIICMYVQVSILYHMHTVCSYSNTLKHMYVVLMFFYIIQLFHIYVCMYVCEASCTTCVCAALHYGTTCCMNVCMYVCMYVCMCGTWVKQEVYVHIL